MVLLMAIQQMLRDSIKKGILIVTFQTNQHLCFKYETSKRSPCQIRIPAIQEAVLHAVVENLANSTRKIATETNTSCTSCKRFRNMFLQKVPAKNYRKSSFPKLCLKTKRTSPEMLLQTLIFRNKFPSTYGSASSVII